MKSLLITIEYPPFKGGVANYYKGLVDNWPEGEILVLDNNKNRLIKWYLFPKWLLAIVKLFFVSVFRRVDHILVGHLLPLGTVAYYVSRITFKPYTVFVHGMDIVFAQRSWRKRMISRKILKKAENIVCGNNYTAGLVREFLGDDYNNKIQVVYPGVEPEINVDEKVKNEIVEKYKLEGKRILFTICRLVKRKGIDSIINVFDELKKEVPNCVYVIAGSGPDEKYLKGLAGDRGDIVFVGGVSEKDKQVWLSLCDVFAMPSRDIEGDFEGFGIVYLEANLHGKPVLGGDSGGVKDAVLGAVSGFLVDPQNKERLISSLVRLLQDEELCNKLGEQGRERVLSDFTCEKQAKKVYNIIIKNK